MSVTTINCHLLPEPPKIGFTKIPDPQQGALVQAVTFGGKEGEGGTGAVGDRLFLKHDLFADKLLLATTSVMFWKPAVEAFAL